MLDRANPVLAGWNRCSGNFRKPWSIHSGETTCSLFSLGLPTYTHLCALSWSHDFGEAGSDHSAICRGFRCRTWPQLDQLEDTETRYYDDTYRTFGHHWLCTVSQQLVPLIELPAYAALNGTSGTSAPRMLQHVSLELSSSWQAYIHSAPTAWLTEAPTLRPTLLDQVQSHWSALGATSVD